LHEHITLLPPDSRPSDGRGISSMLPPDLVVQVRERVALLALLVFVGFALDPLFYFLGIGAADASPADLGFLLDIGAAAASLGLWLVSRARTVPASRLHTIGLAYEVAICFVIALSTMLDYSSRYGRLPNLTWAPAVIIFFPLVLPGPPARMVAAAVIAGAMSPLAVLVLQLTGRIDVGAGAYLDEGIRSALAVLFAYMGARVVYRLGRAVAAARELGSYRLEERLGHGGMGEVWRARHRMLARPAAIKLIRPARLADESAAMTEEAVRRFELEAQATARLRSPHTVTLFDFGVADTGAFYYAMELLEGLDADRLVQRYGPVPPARAVHLLQQLCHSLAEAEACGLVHRDIKPANIFVCRYGQDVDFVKVLDFGLVKAFGAAAVPGTGFTGEGVVAGTPAFMAPEQAMGAGDVDGRADIYATGCVAYWLLTGQTVFQADTPIGLVMHHVQSAPSAPSSRTESPIPPALDQLVIACLAKAPADRPQSAKELARRLLEVECASSWTEERARDWWDRHQPAET